jgi:hypothetical protein
MAKKKQKSIQEEIVSEVRTRRETLLEQKASSDKQYVTRIALGVVGFLAVVLLIGLIVEYAIVPRQAVATVNGENITLSQWQEMVRYQRARLVLGIEEQLTMFVDAEAEDPAAAELQAIGFIQQFSGQQIGLLTNGYQFLGEFVLDQLVADAIVRQGAAERNLTVSEAEIEARLGEQFNYYGGGLPTPAPTASPTPQPTPSLTPLPTFTPEGFVLTDTETLEEDVPVPTVEPLPTNTPAPTATAVSAEAFQEQLVEQDDEIEDMRADPELFRYEVEMSLYREKLADALFIEQGLPTEAEHASAYFILAYGEAEGQALAAQVAEQGFLAVWNDLRSNPRLTGDNETQQPPTAQELLWRTQADYLSFFASGPVSEAIFSLPEGEASELLLDSRSGSNVWALVQVSGREMRPLSEAALSQQKQEVLQTWLDEQRTTQAVIFDNWRTRVPRQPILDTKFSQQIEQAQPPAQPVVPTQ